MIKDINNNKYKPVLIRSYNIEIRKVRYKFQGYGVFATDEIPKDTIIEECVVTKDHISYINNALPNYKFYGEKGDVIILGIACIINHNKDFNCSVNQDLEYERVVKIVATRTIAKDEELYISYGTYYDENGVRNKE
jgi:SET domain-containing protein